MSYYFNNFFLKLDKEFNLILVSNLFCIFNNRMMFLLDRHKYKNMIVIHKVDNLISKRFKGTIVNK